MNHTLSDFSTRLDKKIMIGSDLFHILRPTSSLSASQSLRQLPSKTSEKSGSLKYTTTAQEYRA